MSSASSLNQISVDDYLDGELQSNVKHEYVGGYVYAMVGASNRHNVIAGNVFATLHSALRGGDCRAYNSDTKIRIRLISHVRFYYPDCSVVCDANPQTDSFQDQPTVIVEVLSPSTKRTDEGEKCEAYLTIPTLNAYVLLEQDQIAATIYRRTEHGFVREVISAPDALISLPSIKAELSLQDVYDGVQFDSEAN